MMSMGTHIFYFTAAALSRIPINPWDVCITRDILYYYAQIDRLVELAGALVMEFSPLIWEMILWARAAGNFFFFKEMRKISQKSCPLPDIIKLFNGLEIITVGSSCLLSCPGWEVGLLRI